MPADAHEIVSPLVSVIVTIVLLNVALMCATPRVTPLRIFFFAAPGLPRRRALLLLPWSFLPSADQPDYAVPAVECSESLIATVSDAEHSLQSALVDLRSTYLPSSFTPFLPATVLRGPLRVRALERVRWPRTGGCGGGGCRGSCRCRAAGAMFCWMLPAQRAFDQVRPGR